ncbi:AfsA-related hotdog domain-containing protein [Legionella sp. CNM-4043-24]|uniref:AfsA-related hotdog domain-containing protein n=1 Tax=Legionella sp. CNM-4043-24 TaxID=3421646 RepID=UPI00403B1E61
MKDLKPIYIVGNRLKNFACFDNVYTFDEFKQFYIDVVSAETKSIVYEVRVGQGLSDRCINKVIQLLNRPEAKNIFLINSFLMNLSRGSKLETHKHFDKNIMITSPLLDNDKYISYLHLDDAAAEMSDHITGQHIQGMVLIESARQMINAVAEKFLIPSHISSLKGFVLNRIESNFKQYVFPVEVKLCLEILNIKNGLNGDFKADAKLKVYQNNIEMCCIEISFSVVDKKILSAIEHSMAEKSIYLNRECCSKNTSDALYVA